MKFLRIAFVTLFAVLVLCGCSQSDERRHPLFVKGSRARAEGDGATAKKCFEKLLERRPDATATLLELAGVSDELLDDPLSAALYYRRYLEAVPDAPDKEAIARWQEKAEKRLYVTWKARYEGDVEGIVPVGAGAQAPAVSGDSASAAEVAELRKKLEQYQQRYAAIREEVKRLRSERGIEVNAVAAVKPVANTPAVSGSFAPVITPSASAPLIKDVFPEFYEVKPGDNPGKIAQKLYGDSRKYTLLFQANPKINAKNLKPGMKLVVPKP